MSRQKYRRQFKDDDVRLRERDDRLEAGDRDEIDLDNVFEEMGADFAVGNGVNYSRGDAEHNEEAATEVRSSGYGLAWVAFVFAVASWFLWPVLLGATAGAIGIIAYMQGAKGLGGTAVAIGIAAMLFNLLMVPIY